MTADTSRGDLCHSHDSAINSMSGVLERVGSKVMKIWLRILGGAYIVVGSLHIFLFLFILGAYGGKWGIEAISVEEYFPVIGHLGRWILYVLLGFSGAGILAGVGLLKLSAWSGRLAMLLCVGNLFILPFGTIIGLSTILTLLPKQGRSFLLPAARKPPNSNPSTNKDL